MISFDRLDQEVAALLPEAVKGNGRAVQQLINTIYPAVMMYTRSRMSSNSYPTIEDVVQEICLAVAKLLPRYEDQGKPFMALVYKVASNKIIDARRQSQRDMSDSSEDVAEQAERSSSTTLLSSDLSDSGEEKYLDKESCNEILKLLDYLNEKQREVVTLRVFEGYSAEETARLVGISAGAVRVTQHRALAKLRDIVSNQNNPE